MGVLRKLGPLITDNPILGSEVNQSPRVFCNTFHRVRQSKTQSVAPPTTGIADEACGTGQNTVRSSVHMHNKMIMPRFVHLFSGEFGGGRLPKTSSVIQKATDSELTHNLYGFNFSHGILYTDSV